MFNKTQKSIGAAVIAVAGMAAAANADVIMTFGFTDVSGSYTYNPGDDTGVFRGVAVNEPLLKTAGDVSRIRNPIGTATFLDGFVSEPDPSDFEITINVFNITATTAQGSGSFRITDVDGDTITGDIVSGLWVRGAGQRTFFNGVLANVDVNSDEGFFDGPDGGSFNTAGFQDYIGSVIGLFFRPAGVNFLRQDFGPISSQFSGEIVPTPGAIALVGLGGLVAARRRR